jgi:hypothetical protein
MPGKSGQGGTSRRMRRTQIRGPESPARAQGLMEVRIARRQRCPLSSLRTGGDGAPTGGYRGGRGRRHRRGGERGLRPRHAGPAGRQDVLVRRVVAVHPRTVVVVNSGAPVLLRWAAEVPAVPVALRPCPLLQDQRLGDLPQAVRRDPTPRSRPMPGQRPLHHVRHALRAQGPGAPFDSRVRDQPLQELFHTRLQLGRGTVTTGQIPEQCLLEQPVKECVRDRGGHRGG